MPVADFAQGVERSFPMIGQKVAWAQGKATAPATAQLANAGKDPSNGKSFFENLLDIVNPLEHLPVVDTIYSKLTGDTPGDFEKIAGDTLYGGPMGFVTSLAGVGFEKITGKSLGDTVWDWVFGDDKSTVLASNAKTGAKSAAARATPSTATPGSSTLATASPRILNPLPPRGAGPSVALPHPAIQRAPMAGFGAMAASPSTVAPAMSVASPKKTTAPDAKPAAPAKPAKPDPNAKIADSNIPTLTTAGEQALLAALNRDGYRSDLGQRALFAYQKTMGLNGAAAVAAPAP